MKKFTIFALCGLLLGAYAPVFGMDCLKRAVKRHYPLILTFAAAGTISYVMHSIEYWQDAPHRNLREGVANSDVELVAQAVQDGANCNQYSKGTSLLHKAVQDGQHEIVKWLLQPPYERRADVNREDIKGHAPLYYAVMNEDQEMVNILRRANALTLCSAHMTDAFQVKVDSMYFAYLAKRIG